MKPLIGKRAGNLGARRVDRTKTSGNASGDLIHTVEPRYHELKPIVFRSFSKRDPGNEVGTPAISNYFFVSRGSSRLRGFTVLHLCISLSESGNA